MNILTQNKKTILLTVIIISVFIIAASPDRSSSGAPASHTGAPGEQTCAKAGCHDDNNLNSGTASVTIEMGNGNTQYIAGQTYPIKIKIDDPNKMRFGFQIVALQNQTLANVGNFQITNSVRTQTLKNTYALLDRNYVTYKFNGTDAVSNGHGEWTVNWTAPITNIGPITFYAATVSADDDMTDKGDFTYTASLTVNN